MDDLISRQAAIDALLHNQEVYSNNFGNDPIDKYTIAIIDNDAQTIAQLPSAQPEYHMDEWCTDCKEYDQEKHCCPRFNHVIRTTLQEVQEELDEKDWTFDDDTKQITFVVPIDVYNATQTIFISPGYEGEAGLRGKVFLTQAEKCEDCENFNKTRLLIPQREQKKGKWIRNDNGTYSCSVCQSWVPAEQRLYARYCLYCGLPMEVETE